MTVIFGITTPQNMRLAWQEIPVRNSQLLAVLEIHKPETFGNTLGHRSEKCAEDEQDWPCPTIRAIEEDS